MNVIRVLLCGALLCACGRNAGDSGKTAAQQATSRKTDQAAQEGALKEKADPAADLRAQEANLERLRENAEQDRKAGNRVGAWAAEWDARHARRLIEKDRRRIEEAKRR